jgi:hypothetical protein
MVIARMTDSPRSLALALLYACAMALIAFGSNGQVVAPPSDFTCEIRTAELVRFHKLITQHSFCMRIVLTLRNFQNFHVTTHDPVRGRVLVRFDIHVASVPHAPS